MNLGKIVSTLAALSMAGTLACGDEVHNHYEGANGGNGGSSSGACGDSPFVGRYIWEGGDCDYWSSERVSSATCRAPLDGDVVASDCYFEVDGLTLYSRCPSLGIEETTNIQQVCPNYYRDRYAFYFVSNRPFDFDLCWETLDEECLN